MVSSDIPTLYDSYLKKIKNSSSSSLLTDVLCELFLWGVMHSGVYESKFTKSYSEGLWKSAQVSVSNPNLLISVESQNSKKIVLKMRYWLVMLFHFI